MNTNNHTEQTSNTQYMTIAEVAAQCRTSPETVRYWRHIGYGPGGFKVGRRVLYVAAEVDAWLRSLRQAEQPVGRGVRPGIA